MKILTRFSDILIAHTNALLDRAENPEAMIAQIIREMEDGLGVARGHAASAIAAERWLNRELTKHRSESVHWQTEARAAVAAGRDDLARLALTQKHELEMAAAELANQHAAALKISNEARAALSALEAHLATALRKQRSLIARHRAAHTRRSLGSAAGKRLGAGVTLGSKLQHWEQRMTDLEDQIAAETEVQGLGSAEVIFGRWEAGAEIDRELNALKEETGTKGRS